MTFFNVRSFCLIFCAWRRRKFVQRFMSRFLTVIARLDARAFGDQDIYVFRCRFVVRVLKDQVIVALPTPIINGED